MMMKFFNRRKYFVLNLLQISDSKIAKQFRIEQCLQFCCDFLAETCGMRPDSFSINYSRRTWSSMPGLLKELDRLGGENVCFVYAGLSKGQSKSSIVITNALNNYIEKPLTSEIELHLIFDFDRYDTIGLTTFLTGIFEFIQYDYGYGLTLREDFDLIRESKPNQIDYAEIKYWRNNIKRVNSGDLRKLYPINVLNQAHSKQPVISSLIASGNGKVMDLPGERFLWLFDENSIQMAKTELRKSGLLISKSD